MNLKAEQIAILEAAADSNYDNEDFSYLLAVLDLPGECIGDLKSAVYSRNWKRSRKPFDYVRNKLLRAYLASEKDSDPHEICASDLLKTNHEEGLSRLANDSYDEDGYEESSLRERVNERFRCYWAPSAKDAEDFTYVSDGVDWPLVAKEANLDEWETKALMLMFRGQSLYVATKDADRNDARPLEAAWKRLTRSKLKEVKRILLTT